jgi:quinol monooxygenase YgiN
MKKFAFYAQLKPKPGMEKDLEAFVALGDIHTKNDDAIVQSFSMNGPEGSYCLFDIFDTEAARNDHFEGKTAKQLAAVSESLLNEPPLIHLLEIVAQK